MKQLLALILPLIAIAGSCSSSNGISWVYPIDDDTRQATSRVWVVSDNRLTQFSLSEASGESPLEIGFLPAPSLRGSDNQHAYEYIKKVEVDFDDEQGYRDLTPEFKHALEHLEALSPEHVIRRTYDEPGEYRIRIRATYWDGEVVTCDEHTTDAPPPVRVTVTEPAAP